MEDTFLNQKIKAFYKRQPEVFKPPLEFIINKMLKHCAYDNGESLERHNWGDEPLKLKCLPLDINSPNLVEEILICLDMNENQKAILELLWGDPQLGKRIHALIIMWFSVYIIKRPVLYIFRCLNVDKKQLQDDIAGTEEYNFNIQFIKNFFNDFNCQIQKFFDDSTTKNDYWKDFSLPELKDIRNNGIIDKLSNKDALNPTDMFCCLMHYEQLEKIKEQFVNYICNHKELVNITVIVDEGDLTCPTASNDGSDKNDIKNSTACEKLIAQIFKMVRYALDVTGTGHSLLYNTTTVLSEDQTIQTKIERVHVMKMSDNYYGFSNGKIYFDTDHVTPWWEYKDQKYDIIEDYNINIKQIADIIVKRKTTKYNSFLITEEKVRFEQFSLVYKFLQDFPDIFVIIFHGGCLRLYLSKDYEQELKNWAQWDAGQCSGKRLWQTGGIYGSSIDTEKSVKLPNNYCYFEIDSKKLNIKMVYKLLAILFIESTVAIKHKTVITITGKYGMRGYSFTSDDFGKYSMHLTDQYQVAHASIFNCTNAHQTGRIQVLSSDIELKNGTMKLTLWTTKQFQDIMQNFYINFIKELKRHTPNCKGNDEIKNCVESIIDKGNKFKFKTYMKYIDAKKKRGNLKIHKHREPKNNGYRLITTDDMSENELAEWCRDEGFPEYSESTCVNTVERVDDVAELTNSDKIWYAKLTPISYDKNVSIKHQTYTIDENTEEQYKNKILKYIAQGCINSYKSLAVQNKCVKTDTIVLIIDNINIKKYKAAFMPENYKKNTVKDSTLCNLPKNYILYEDINGHLWKSSLKEEYKKKDNHGYLNEDDNFIQGGGLPDVYYWKTPDGWLFLHDKSQGEIYTLIVKTPKQTNSNANSSNVIIHAVDSGVKLFVEACFKAPARPNLRFCLKDIYKIYEQWCESKGNKPLKTQKRFKEELEKLNYTEDTSQGVDINGNSGKRGYNVLVSL